MLIHVLFAATALGGLGLLGSALAADVMGARLLGIALYGAAPGVVAWLLSRRAWTGGPRLWLGLLAVQGWFVLGSLANIGNGSARGFTQLFLPVLVLWFLTRKESRAWFRLPEVDREDKPPFSLPYMITWRRDRGQSSLEYVGLIVLVAAIIVGLVATGVSTDIAAKMGRQVCRVVGDGDCGDGGDSGDGTRTEAGKRPDTKAHDSDGQGDSDGTTRAPDHEPGDPKATDPETSREPEAEYDTQPAADYDDSGDSGGGADGGDKAEDEEAQQKACAIFGITDCSPEAIAQSKKKGRDCSGFGLLKCGLDQAGQVGKGIGLDGVWGDIKGSVQLFDPDTWVDIGNYGKQLGKKWWKDATEARADWSEGNYWDSTKGWSRATQKTVVKVLDDAFVGDEVRERWNNGQKTRAVADVIYNVGSLAIPGYGLAKLAQKFSKLGKAGRIAEKVANAAKKAGDAAKRARRAAKAGDVEEARRAAKEADEAADAAELQARKTGCVIALGSPTGIPTSPGLAGGLGGSGSGSGTVVLAAGGPSRVILASDGCDAEAKAKAKEARKQERDAYLAKKRAEEPQRAKEAELKRKKWPAPKRNNTRDPRNYQDPDWAKDLKDPKLGDIDGFDGYWGSRYRNPKPGWKHETWLRYQEQISGVKRGKEYIVPHPKEGVPDVEFDGWDSGRRTFLEAKSGYKSFLKKDGSLTSSGKKKFIAEARRQMEASGGLAVEWHFSDPNVAKAARKAFREENMPIKVVHTKRKETGGPRNPSRFDRR
ncbi:restriction endonuclease fold toxin 5 domain-containing protein [Streptomyces sp. RY43-2]|uniref:Restriction endonuclease fold toxin 5 domain-containing protein n=1 Tax=Streptomyces macrolidinus TaxID=2952607 RepID=A0ABT0ZLI8_9ACTN|nr:Tox-REase-5 domain-containing protein [Streptomyces macrolidinus]MCN9244452.1 restriction endonuclease fold toxin 5 domain-containing protein [Streptomyces macrolidinus]